MPHQPTISKAYPFAVAALVFWLLFALKLFFTPEITIQGDEFEKWYEVRRLVNGFSLTRLDHHTARFGLMWPAYLFQIVLGSKPLVYHLMMSFVYASTGLLAFLIYREYRLSNILTLLSVAVVAFVPSYTTYGAQFLPSPFSILYILAMILLLIKLLNKVDSVYLVALASACFFMAYGSKITNLYFLPAIIVYIYVYVSKMATVRFLGFLAVFYMFEQLLNAHLTGQFSLFSRLHLMSFHNSVMDERTYQAKDIIGRWLMLPGMYLFFLLSSMALSVAVLLKKHAQPLAVLLALMILTYALFLTFAITSLSPLKFAEPLRTRYFFPLALISYLTVPILLLSLFPGHAWVRIVALTGILFVNVPLMLSNSKTHAFTANKYADLFDGYYKRGVWLLFTESKTARLHRAVYLSDEALFENGPDIPIFGKVYTAFFQENSMHVPLAINLVRSPAINEYAFVNRRKGVGEIVSFVPPEQRKNNNR